VNASLSTNKPQRVVITGAGTVSALGNDWATVKKSTSVFILVPKGECTRHPVPALPVAKHLDMPLKPFVDTDRDGLVLGEGACTLIMESFEHAKARGANILAEVIGFATNTDGSHLVRPNQATMEKVIAKALNDANITADAVGYISAHGTATEHGDIAESQATFKIMGNKPISSLKSYTGHTLGACGAFEAWASIMMMNENWFAPTLNLDSIDDRCGKLDLITFPYI